MELQKIEAAIERSRRGIAQYLEIMERFPRVDVSSDREFQRMFNAFYRMRQRPLTWYDVFYSALEESKSIAPTFDSVLDHFVTRLGRCEASFSSKLVATVNPRLPVWDQYVLRNTGISAPYYGSKNRVARIKSAYARIVRWYEIFLASDEGEMVVQAFEMLVQEHPKITDLKKVDFVLWQMRDSD